MFTNPLQSNETLIKAIAEADIKTVIKILDHDRSLVESKWTRQGLTPLHIACGLYARESKQADFTNKQTKAREFEAICQELIYRGALPTTKTATGKAITDLTDGRVPPCVRTWFKAQTILGRFEEKLRETGSKRKGTRGFEKNIKKTVEPIDLVYIDKFENDPNPIFFARLKPDFFPVEDEEEFRDYQFGNPILTSVKEDNYCLLADERLLTIPHKPKTKKKSIGGLRSRVGFFA